MFTEKCFIRKYSQELVNKLIEIGHNVIRFSESRYIVCDKNDVYLTSILPDKDIDEYICCDTNEELFLAIASIRNDTDKYQWFIYNSMDCTVEKLRDFYWFKCEEDKIEDMMYWDCAYLNCTKATVKELIEHFK